MPTFPKKPGFRLGIYVFKDVEIVDFAAPYGVFSVARRFDPELDAFLIADALRPVRRRPGSPCCRTTVRRAPGDGRLPHPGRLRHAPGDVQRPAARVHPRAARRRRCSPACAPARGSTAGWACSTACPRPTARSPTGVEVGRGKVPIDRLAEIAPACRISRARVVDAGRIVTAGGITSGMEMGFHLLRRAGYDESSSPRWRG